MNVAFTVSVAESIGGGFSFTTFMESLGYFFFELENAWTNEDYQEWVRISDDVCTTILYLEDRDIMLSHPTPTLLNEALNVFNSAFWSHYGDSELSQEEAEEIALNYSKHLLKNHI